MFGLQYDLTCPYCGKTFLVDHGITSYYNIKGYEDIEYIKEHCRCCGQSYFRACYGSDLMNMKLNKKTYEEALIELEKIDERKNKYYYSSNVPEERLKEQEEHRITSCNKVYSTDDKKLYINVTDVNKEDLIISDCVCW